MLDPLLNCLRIVSFNDEGRKSWIDSQSRYVRVLTKCAVIRYILDATYASIGLGFGLDHIREQSPRSRLIVDFFLVLMLEILLPNTTSTALRCAQCSM